MENIIQDWNLWLFQQSFRPATVEYYIKYLASGFRFFNYSWEDFQNKEKMQDVWDKVWKRDISNSTRKKHLMAMRRFADFLMSQGLLEVNYPREIMKTPKVQQALPFAMDRSDFGSVYRAIEKRWGDGAVARRNRMIFDTIIYTGLRREEVTKILRSDVADDRISVRDGKGGKPRTVFLPIHFSEKLQEFMRETQGISDYLFYIERGKYGKALGDCMTPAYITNLFGQIARYAGKRVYAHMLRHTYASNCTIDGVDIFTLQQQMGHSDIKTTSIYLYLNDRARYEKIQLLR